MILLTNSIPDKESEQKQSPSSRFCRIIMAEILSDMLKENKCEVLYKLVADLAKAVEIEPPLDLDAFLT